MPYYDLASFLWQASGQIFFCCVANWSTEYYDAETIYPKYPVRHFVNRLSLPVLFPHLQVLGLMASGISERKNIFDSIPPAIQNLRDV